MRAFFIIVSLAIVTGCDLADSMFEERALDRMREDYLKLEAAEDKEAIEAFDQFFNAAEFRKDYHIHLSEDGTNNFRWGPLKDWPAFGRYWFYMAPVDSVPLHRNSMYHMYHAGPGPPKTAESLDDALTEGFARLQDDKPVAELVDHPVVVAAREGDTGKGGHYITVVVELHDEHFAIGSLMNTEHRAKAVRHLAKLLDTTRSANQSLE